MAQLILNGVTPVQPSEMSVDLFDVSSEDGAGRNEAGTASKDIIARKRKISCKWAPLTKAEMAAIVNAVKSGTIVFFPVQHEDIGTAVGLRTTICYVGDMSAPYFNANADQGKVWSGLSANFIEQ